MEMQITVTIKFDEKVEDTDQVIMNLGNAIAYQLESQGLSPEDEEAGVDNYDLTYQGFIFQFSTNGTLKAINS